MKIVERLLSWMLLACVVMALGDAPYVDELFDALPGADSQVQLAQGAQVPQKPATRFDHSSRLIRIYQALATIFTSPSSVAIAPSVAAGCYFAVLSRTPPSVDPSRIDRPPAIPAA